MTKSTKSTKWQWPPGSQRALLKWLDEHKGPQSPLLQDRKGGLRQLRESLLAEFQKDSKFTRRLSQTEIERRLKSLWSDRLESINSPNLEVFYEQGSSALDWDKLSHRPIGKDYSEDEIESFKRRTARNITTAADLSKGDSEHDEDDLDDQNSRNPRPRDSATETSSDEDPVRSNKRRKVDHSPAVETLGRKKTRGASRRENLSGGSREGRNNRAGAIHGPRNAAPAASTATANGSGNVTPTDHLEATEEGNHPSRMPGSPFPNTFVLSDKLPVQLQNDEEGNRTQFDWNDQIDRLRYRIIRTATDPEAVKSTMQGLGIRIGSAVNSFATLSGIPEQQPALLDANLRYPHECLILLHDVLGDIGDYGTDRRSERLLAFHQTQTNLVEFLESFVWCAMTSWCFYADIDENTWYSRLSAGDVKYTFEEAFDPILQAEIRRRLWNKHVSTHVIPNIDSEAHRMAVMLETYIHLLIPADRPNVSFIRDRHVISLPLSDPKKTATSTDVPQPDFKLKEPRERLELRNRLAAIFKDALKWRTELSMCLNEQYMYLWPHFLAPYISDEHRRRSSNDLHSDEDQGRRVRLGMKPIVWKRSRELVGGEWSEWKRVCKGEVLPL